jgi:hypothetical protein
MNIIKPTREILPVALVANTFKFRRYPIDGMTASRVSQPFGVNWAFNYAVLGILAHNGADIVCPTGTRLYAMFDGEVTENNWSAQAGNKIEYASTGFAVSGFDGTYRLRICYLHCLRSITGTGKQINTNDWIAISDNTGSMTTGPHVHVGLKIDRKTDTGWEVLDQDNGFGGCIDPQMFWPDKTYELLPVDYRYTLPYSLTAEAYKRAVTPWLRLKLRRWPTERELTAFAYGHWGFEEVQGPSMFTAWTTYTKPMFDKLTHPPQPLGI